MCQLLVMKNKGKTILTPFLQKVTVPWMNQKRKQWSLITDSEHTGWISEKRYIKTIEISVVILGRDI